MAIYCTLQYLLALRVYVCVSYLSETDRIAEASADIFPVHVLIRGHEALLLSISAHCSSLFFGATQRAHWFDYMYMFGQNMTESTILRHRPPRSPASERSSDLKRDQPPLLFFCFRS